MRKRKNTGGKDKAMRKDTGDVILPKLRFPGIIIFYGYSCGAIAQMLI